MQCRSKRTVGGQVEINEEIVRQGLRDVRTIYLEGHEHDNGKHHDLCVALPHKCLFLAPRPPRRGIKTVYVFPIHESQSLL